MSTNRYSVAPAARHTVSIAVSMLGLVAVLAACGTDTNPTRPPTRIVTITSTAPAAAPPSDAGDATPAEGANEQAETPAVPADAPAVAAGCNRSPDVAADAQRIAPPLSDNPDAYWVTGQTGGTRCDGLSWVSLDTNGATASSPMQLLIYHNGYFQGTGIKCNAGYQTVLESSPNSIQVRYRYLQGNDISARPSGSATVTFRWNGSQVVMDGALPYGVTQGEC